MLKECGCLVGSDDDRLKMDIAGLEFNRRTSKIAAEIQARGSATFTAIVQPAVDSLPFNRYGEVIVLPSRDDDAVLPLQNGLLPSVRLCG